MKYAHCIKPRQSAFGRNQFALPDGRCAQGGQVVRGRQGVAERRTDQPGVDVRARRHRRPACPRPGRDVSDAGPRCWQRSPRSPAPGGRGRRRAQPGSGRQQHRVDRVLPHPGHPLQCTLDAVRRIPRPLATARRSLSSMGPGRSPRPVRRPRRACAMLRRSRSGFLRSSSPRACRNRSRFRAANTTLAS